MSDLQPRRTEKSVVNDAVQGTYSVTAAAPAQIAAFVEQGLGISNDASSVTASASISSGTLPSSIRTSSGISSHISASIVLSSKSVSSNLQLSETSASTTHVSSNPTTSKTSGASTIYSTAPPKGTAPSRKSSVISSKAANTTGFYPNASIPFDQCYNSWQVYWKASSAYTPAVTSVTWTSVTTVTWTRAAVPATTATITWSAGYETDYDVNGQFTVATITKYVSAGAYTYTEGGKSAEGGTFTETDVSYAPGSALPTPQCSIPAIVPACQSSWDAYISRQLIPSPTPPQHCNIYQGIGRFDTRTQLACASAFTDAKGDYDKSLGAIPKPTCEAAAVTGTLCESVRDNWQQGVNFNFVPLSSHVYRLITSHGSLNIGTDGDGWTWRTHSTLGVARGCTLGCGRCEVTGGTVQLIYWPQSTRAAIASTGFHLNSTRRASPAPTATGLVTAVTLGTTFTSPTLYISYEAVHASNACGPVGTPMGSTIIAIPTQSKLSSIYGIALPCGRVMPSDITTLTAPFTVADLNEPVPYSIYSSQPLCQTQLRVGRCNGTVCPTTAPFRPILVVPNQLYKELQPAWADCWGDVHGVLDPPIALQGTSAPDGVTVTSAVDPTSTPATPSPPKVDTIPKMTAGVPTSAVQDLLPVSSGVAGKQTGGVLDPAQQSIGGVQDPSVQDPSVQDPSVQSIGGVQDPAAQSKVQTVPVRSIAGVQTQSVGDVQDPVAPAPPNTAIVESKTFVVVSISTGVVVAAGGVTSTFGAGATVSLAGEQVNIPSSGAVIIGTGSAAQTVAFTKSVADPQQTVVAVGSQAVTFAPAPSGGLIVANGGSTTTVSAGGIVTVGGQQVSLAPSGSIILGSGSSASTIALPPAPTTIVAGGQSVTVAQAPGGAGVVVANGGTTRTVIPGAAAVTVGGQQVSVAIGDSVVVGQGISATTILLAHTTASSSAFVIGSETVTILPASGATGVVVVDHGTTTTIQAGSIVTIEGQRFSAGSDIAVIGTGTSAATVTLSSPSKDQTIVLGSQTVTLVRVSTGIIVVDRGTSTTIAAGMVATVEGQRVSVGVNGLVAVGTGSSASTISVRVATHVSSPTNTVRSTYTNTVSSTGPTVPIQQATSPQVSTQEASSRQQSTSGSGAVLPGEATSMMRSASSIPLLVGVLILPFMLGALSL